MMPQTSPTLSPSLSYKDVATKHERAKVRAAMIIQLWYRQRKREETESKKRKREETEAEAAAEAEAEAQAKAAMANMGKYKEGTTVFHGEQGVNCIVKEIKFVPGSDTDYYYMVKNESTGELFALEQTLQEVPVLKRQNSEESDKEANKESDEETLQEMHERKKKEKKRVPVEKVITTTEGTQNQTTHNKVDSFDDFLHGPVMSHIRECLRLTEDDIHDFNKILDGIKKYEEFLLTEESKKVPRYHDMEWKLGPARKDIAKFLKCAVDIGKKYFDTKEKKDWSQQGEATECPEGAELAESEVEAAELAKAEAEKTKEEKICMQNQDSVLQNWLIFMKDPQYEETVFGHFDGVDPEELKIVQKQSGETTENVINCEYVGHEAFAADLLKSGTENSDSVLNLIDETLAKYDSCKKQHEGGSDSSDLVVSEAITYLKMCKDLDVYYHDDKFKTYFDELLQEVEFFQWERDFKKILAFGRVTDDFNLNDHAEACNEAKDTPPMVMIQADELERVKKSFENVHNLCFDTFKDKNATPKEFDKLRILLYKLFFAMEEILFDKKHPIYVCTQKTIDIVELKRRKPIKELLCFDNLEGSEGKHEPNGQENSMDKLKVTVRTPRKKKTDEQKIEETLRKHGEGLLDAQKDICRLAIGASRRLPTFIENLKCSLDETQNPKSDKFDENISSLKRNIIEARNVPTQFKREAQKVMWDMCRKRIEAAYQDLREAISVTGQCELPDASKNDLAMLKKASNDVRKNCFDVLTPDEKTRLISIDSESETWKFSSAKRIQKKKASADLSQPSTPKPKKRNETSGFTAFGDNKVVEPLFMKLIMKPENGGFELTLPQRCNFASFLCQVHTELHKWQKSNRKETGTFSAHITDCHTRWISNHKWPFPKNSHGKAFVESLGTTILLWNQRAPTGNFVAIDLLWDIAKTIGVFPEEAPAPQVSGNPFDNIEMGTEFERPTLPATDSDTLVSFGKAVDESKKRKREETEGEADEAAKAEAFIRIIERADLKQLCLRSIAVIRKATIKAAKLKQKTAEALRKLNATMDIQSCLRSLALTKAKAEAEAEATVRAAKIIQSWFRQRKRKETEAQKLEDDEDTQEMDCEPNRLDTDALTITSFEEEKWPTPDTPGRSQDVTHSSFEEEKWPTPDTPGRSQDVTHSSFELDYEYDSELNQDQQ